MASKLFMGKGLSQTVQWIVKTCKLCQRNNPLNLTTAPPGMQRHGKYPGEDWQLDFTICQKVTPIPTGLGRYLF